MPIEEEVKYTSKLIEICKNISIECLNKEFKIPECNEDCLNIYD